MQDGFDFLNYAHEVSEIRNGNRDLDFDCYNPDNSNMKISEAESGAGRILNDMPESIPTDKCLSSALDIQPREDDPDLVQLISRCEGDTELALEIMHHFLTQGTICCSDMELTNEPTKILYHAVNIHPDAIYLRSY